MVWNRCFLFVLLVAVGCEATRGRELVEKQNARSPGSHNGSAAPVEIPPSKAGPISREPSKAEADESLPERAEAERNTRIDPLVQSELETIAGCFRNAVQLLQAEPEPGERLHAFLGKAATKKRQGKPELPAECRNLSRHAFGRPLLVSTGDEVEVTIGERSHDDFDDGHSEDVTVYVFTAGEGPEKATTMIARVYGRPSHPAR
jgi:hypothetical protein